VQKFSGEVQNDLRGGAHLPSKSGYGKRIYNAQNYAYVKIWKAHELIVILIRKTKGMEHFGVLE
jgi:hypothetical protein